MIFTNQRLREIAEDGFLAHGEGKSLAQALLSADLLAINRDKRIAELERANASQDDHINQQQDRMALLEKKVVDLRGTLRAALKRLATPVRLPAGDYPDGDIDCPLVISVDEAMAAIRAAGFNVEGEA